MTHRTTGSTVEREDLTRADALETLVLWPRSLAEPDAPRPDTDPWPVFVVVIGDEAAEDIEAARAVLDLLDVPRSPTDTITNSACWWSVVGPDQAVLSLAVLVLGPVRVAMDIAVPAQCFLGLSRTISAGATVGVTTRRHARRLTTRTDDRTVLDEVVLLGGRTSSELAEVAEMLCGEVRT